MNDLRVSSRMCDEVTYLIQPRDAVLTDGRSVSLWLHDLPQDAAKLRLHALVASGDYFEMLAARLEQVAAAIPEASVEQHQLQEAVGQLLYLQREFVIRKKTDNK